MAKSRLNLRKLAETLPAEEPVPDEPVPNEPGGEYHDQEDEFGEDGEFGQSVSQDSDLRHVMRQFVGMKGIEGQSDFQSDQAAIVLAAKLAQRNPKFAHFGFGYFSEWFSFIQLSMGRKSRTEQVDVLRGNVSLQPTQDNKGPQRGF